MAGSEMVTAIGGAFVAVIGAIGVLVSGFQSRRKSLDVEDEKRLADYDAWEPKVRRYIAGLRRQLSDLDQETIDPPILGSKEVNKP